MASAERPDLPPRRMRRAERRAQILAAATDVFALHGFAATSLDELAEAAGVSRVILYRHFDSKSDLYRAVLERVEEQLTEAVGESGYDRGLIGSLIGAAARHPSGFRLLFRHAAREPEFRERADELSTLMADVAHQRLAGEIADERWARWAAALLPQVMVEAILAWLDAGCPDPDLAQARIRCAVDAVIEAARLEGPAAGRG